MIQEDAVFLRVGGHVPAESPLAVDDDFRRRCGAPLGEGVDHLESFDAAFAGGFNPAVKQREVECVPAFRLGDSDELACGAFPADGGVKGNGPERREEDVDAVPGHVLQVVPENAPEPLVLESAVIPLLEAVGVEPGTGPESLLRQLRRDYVKDDVYAFRRDFREPFQVGFTLCRGDGNPERMLAGGAFARNVHRHPDAEPFAVAWHREQPAGEDWQQGVWVEAWLRRNPELVERVAWMVAEDHAHLSQVHAVAEERIHIELHKGMARRSLTPSTRSSGSLRRRSS